MAIIDSKELPSGNWRYKIDNPVGKCFSAGKFQLAAKTLDSIPIFNINFTEQEYEEETSIYLRESNGVTITKDHIWFTSTRELTQQEIDKINTRLEQVKVNLVNFLD